MLVGPQVKHKYTGGNSEQVDFAKSLVVEHLTIFLEVVNTESQEQSEEHSVHFVVFLRAKMVHHDETFLLVVLDMLEQFLFFFLYGIGATFQLSSLLLLHFLLIFLLLVMTFHLFGSFTFLLGLTFKSGTHACALFFGRICCKVPQRYIVKGSLE